MSAASNRALIPKTLNTSLTSLARFGVESGGALVERSNESILALNTALDRLSCVYALGFKDDDLGESRTLPLEIKLRRKGLHAAHAAFYVRRTESMKRASRLSAAFIDPDSADDGSVRALLIPSGGDGKTWKAAMQVRMRPSGVADNSAELGASVVRFDRVTDQFSSSIAARSGARPLVLEKSVDIAPGAFSVVAVAHDVKRDNVASNRLDADWPNPAECAAAIAPIAALQLGPAVISKDGDVKLSGSVARGVDEPIDRSTGVSLVSVVCRGAKANGPVIVERWLEGGSRDEFAPMTIAETDQACLQTVDAVGAGRLRPGPVDYRVIARVGDEIVAQERRTLRVGVEGAVPLNP